MAETVSSNILNLLAATAHTVIPLLDAPREDADGLHQVALNPDHFLARANRLQAPPIPMAAAKAHMDLQWYWLFLGWLIIHNGEEYLFADRLADVFTDRGIRLPLTRLRVGLVIVKLAGLAFIPMKMADIPAADPLLAEAALVRPANAVIPHLVASLALKRNTAGVVSASLLMAPGRGLILQAASAARLTNRAIVLAALTVAGPLLLFLWLFIGAALTRGGPPEIDSPRR